MACKLIVLGGVISVTGMSLAAWVGFRRSGLFLMGLCFATAPMNAVRIQDIPLSDLFLGIGFLALLAAYVVDIKSDRFFFVLPLTLLVPAGLYLVSALMNELSPTSTAYLRSRFHGEASFGVLENANLVQFSKFFVAFFILPIVAMLFKPSFNEGLLLVRFWLLGTAISALVGIGDLFGIFSLGVVSKFSFEGGDRVAGLATHPNHLGASIAIAAPMLFVFGGRAMRIRLERGVLLAIFLLGEFASGSRTGQAGALLAVAASVMMQPSLARWKKMILPIVGFGSAGAATQPETISRFLTRTRFASGVAKESNLERSLVRSQGVDDFLHRPIFGIGYGHLNEAHEAHIQVASATGIIGMIAAVVYFISSFRVIARVRALEYSIGMGLFISLGCWMALAFSSNFIADRYLYVPIALGYALSRNTSKPM